MTLYIPPQFRIDDEAALARFIDEHAFGTLVSAGPGGMHVSHIPFLADTAPDGLKLLGHVARGNAHWELLRDGAEALAIFQGPHAYVSPGWYAQHPAVPTWNYAAVHAQGAARLLDPAELHDLLMRLSAKYEAARPSPWKMSELPAAFVDTMLQAIVGFEIAVSRLEGKFKLSQNRPAEIPRVIDALERGGQRDLAALMRAHPPTTKG